MPESVTQEELLDIGSRMAQELQEFIDDAENDGNKNPLPGVKQLVDEWEEIYSRANGTWQKLMQNIDNADVEPAFKNL